MTEGPQFIFGQPPPPEVQKAMAALHKRHEELNVEGRRQVRQFEAILCTCRRRFVWTVSTALGEDEVTEFQQPHPGLPPPQTGCVVHGGVMPLPGGGWL